MVTGNPVTAALAGYRWVTAEMLLINGLRDR